MRHLLRALLGCRHREFTFPRSTRNGKTCRMYICCVSCGREFEYSWSAMKRGKPLER